MKGKYRITVAGKILIAQLFISFMGWLIGFTWGLHAENKNLSVLLNKKSTVSAKNSNAIDSDLVSKTSASAPIQVKEAGTKDSIILNTCISSANTSLTNSTPERSNNIEICAKAINGKLIMPGEVFSFNQVVGERTKEKGYLEAPAIIDNRIEPSVGGGICQVTSTLYDAVLMAGIKNIDRTHHSIPVSYVKPGLDATVEWGNIDFKFTNTLEYPISIEGYVQNTELYINIYSNPNLNKKKYTIENVPGVNGANTEVIRKTYENGVVTNIENISSDEYMNGNLN
ncbi:MAG: VanW family protein [Solirubrobacterales bacterium]